jgi:error-prone DNA polymerase
MVAFAELIAASNFSFLRGASHPHEMVGQAAELGLAGIGIADRNTLAGVVRAHQAAKDYGIRLLVGARLVTTDGFETVCYPIDRSAYGRLCRLLTSGNRRALKGECHFTFQDMLAESEGQLFIVVPPRRPSTDFADRLFTLAKAAPGRSYFAVTFAYRGDEQRRLGELAELAATARTPLLATADALHHHPNRRLLADVLTCIREKCTITQAGYRLEANAERHLKPAVEISRLFARYPEAITRTFELVGRITFRLDQLRYEYPQEPVPPGSKPQAFLEELTARHARLRYPDGVPAKVQALIDKELDLIARLDYARYFLTVYDIVRYAREELETPILCQGRGSSPPIVVSRPTSTSILSTSGARKLSSISISAMAATVPPFAPPSFTTDRAWQSARSARRWASRKT